MSLVLAVYVAVLFFVLVPGILLSLPKGGSKLVVAAVHALVFGVVFYLTCRPIARLGARLEGFNAEGEEEEKEEGMETMAPKKK